MRYEAHDVPIKPFIRLKAKHFSCLTEDDHEFRRRKGINKNVINKIGFENNKKAQFNKKCVKHELNKIENKDHNKGTYNIKYVFFYLNMITKNMYFKTNTIGYLSRFDKFTQ